MISVVLPFRNAAATLTAATTSVLADLGADDEVVLVDDGSTDGGGFSGPRVRLFRTAGIGLAEALNLGIREARGELIARMDADDISLPGRIAAQAALLESDASLGVVATRVEVFGAPGPGIERFVRWQNLLLTPADHARSIFVETPLCHPSVMLRRSALEAVGGYREGPAEDYDLWLRMHHAGFQLAKVPTVLLRWRIHEANKTWSLTFDALRKVRAEHLAKRIDRPFAVWGAGAAGRRLARELEAHTQKARFFIDIDPKKIGRIARAVPIVGIEAGIARVKEERLLLIVAVAAQGARDRVRDHLRAAGFEELRDFVCAA